MKGAGAGDRSGAPSRRELDQSFFLAMPKGVIYITWKEFFALAEQLARKIPGAYRTWLLVGTNGFRVAAALHRYAGDEVFKNANIACIRASHYRGRRKKEAVKLGPVVGKLVRPVLIVDDLVDSGGTVLAVRKKIGMRAAPVAVLFQKPGSPVRPEHVVETTSQWVVFPWERRSVR